MEQKEKTVLALGMFDGVHIGHRKLIETAKLLAGAMDASCCAYTFSNHPASLLGRDVRLLCSVEEREFLLADCGADSVHMEPFTKELMHLSPELFVARLLEQWDVIGLVAGSNFTFGDRGAGDAERLCELGKERGIIVRILPLVENGGEIVSSSRIRELLENGKIRSAAELLGRSYSVSGEASVSDGIIRLEAEPGIVLPKEGTYKTQILTENGLYESTSRVYETQDCRYTESLLSDPGMYGANKETMLVFRSEL